MDDSERCPNVCSLWRSLYGVRCRDPSELEVSMRALDAMGEDNGAGREKEEKRNSQLHTGRHGVTLGLYRHRRFRGR